ncbi:MAG TPA: lipocalin family protein [Puia sp.]|nr:lipocalin family protein [Puia sp.]
MRKIALAASIGCLILVINACKKSDSNSSNPSARTVQNLSGSYKLTAITASVLGANINLYDSLPACDQDNVIELDTNKTAHFIDAGVKCVPPSDSTGTWSLSSNTDTIYVSGTANFIKSWDGKTLMLNSVENLGGIPVPITATTTLVKQ